MALPASGAISLSQVNVELGLSATAQIGMNDAAVRTLFGVASGAISMSDGYGKANQFNLVISSDQTNTNLRVLAINAGWNQVTKLVATINGGIVVSSNSTGTPALTINGSFPGGLALTNNGFIVGMGGNGGNGNVGAAGSPGGAGGLALSVSSAVTINNSSGTIAGGGGGGGGGFGTTQTEYTAAVAGSGGGGGRTGRTNSSGGSGPAVGGAGTFSGAGAGGPAVSIGGPGGNGGDWGQAGQSPDPAGFTGDGSAPTPPGAGGAAGAAVSGNGNITYMATGTRLGAIS